MTKPNDPAFTTSEIVQFNSGPALASMGGLTKREYFAAMAMQGFISNSGVDMKPEHTAEASIKHADALIDALNKPPEGTK